MLASFFSVTLSAISREGKKMKATLMQAGMVLLSVLIVASFIKMYLFN